MTDERAARVVTPGGAAINTGGTSGDHLNGTAQLPATVDGHAVAVDHQADGLVEPQWTPPPGLTDPFVRRLPVTRAVWSRARRGHLRSAPTRGGDPGLRDLAVAGALADYGNPDGSRCRPGVRRLADDIGLSERTVRRALAGLVDAGWIGVPSRGARKLRKADEHHLTVPAPVAVVLGLWDRDEPQWMERPSGAPGRRATPSHAGSTGQESAVPGAVHDGSSGQHGGSSGHDHDFYRPRRAVLADTLGAPHQETREVPPGTEESAGALSVNASASTVYVSHAFASTASGGTADEPTAAAPKSRQATIRRAVRALADDGWPVAGPGPDDDADELADAIAVAAGLTGASITGSTIAGMAASGCDLFKIVGHALNVDAAAS